MPDIANGKTPELAVLYERMTRVLDDYSELRGLVMAQNIAIQQFAVLHKDVATLNEKTDRIFKALSAQADITNAHSQQLTTHSTTWKIVAVMLAACSGLVGFSYQTIRALEIADTSADRRLLSLEYKIDSFNASQQLKSGWNNDNKGRETNR